MSDENAKIDVAPGEQRILRALLDDPTKSLRNIAAELKTYRQKIWRVKRRLEDEKIVWGYTAILDEMRMGHCLSIIMLKLKPMSRDLADLMIERVVKRVQKKQNVELLTMYYVNGEYDYIIVFSAPDHATARRYYDSLRTAYDQYILEKPVIVDVNFTVIREGKINPEIEGLRRFVPA
ncbi:MAG: Lrp/AsnC family transcriptional regulator [Candidatus Thermoplasmatota archaeon]|nr:Lrp/AsnC family transcriptional regulator [Candidatus Thermoplasmatota archaeon]